MYVKLWLGFLLILLFVSQSSAQSFKFTPEKKGYLKRGTSIEITLVVTSDKPITITKISPSSEEGFDIAPSEVEGPVAFKGSRRFKFRISRPLVSGFGGPSTGEKQVIFSIDYTIDDKAEGTADEKAQHTVDIEYTFLYSTAAPIYYGCGFLGLLLGYIVKSIVTKLNERPADGGQSEESFLHYMFVRNLPRMLVLLILGFAALIFFDMQVDSVFGFAKSILLGLGIGLMGDETLVQKIQGTVKF